MSEKLDKAFIVMDRTNFLPDDATNLAGFNAPIPIGYGQTNSQPETVRLMLEWLDPKPKEKILDVGSGSGWTTALLSYLVGEEGAVYAVERVPQLLQFGSDNCKKLELKNVHFRSPGAEYGLPEYAPYDKILVSAAANEMPASLVKQIKTGGKMVIPVLHSIYVVNKVSDAEIKTDEHAGFAFVPLV